MTKRLMALFLALMLMLSTTALAWDCPSCGSDNGGKFCTECGTKKPDDRICPSCGTNHGQKNYAFCTECGAKMDTTAPTEQPTATPKPTAAPKPPLVPTAKPTATPKPTAAPTTQPEEQLPAFTLMGDAMTGTVLLMWDEPEDTDYEVRYLRRFSDDPAADANAPLGLGIAQLKSKIGITTLTELLPGEKYWIGLFDDQGRGEYVPYEATSPQGWAKENDSRIQDVFVQLRTRTGEEDQVVDAFTLADVASENLNVGLFMAIEYNNAGEEFKPFVRIQLTAPNDLKLITHAAQLTFSANTEAYAGWSFANLTKFYQVLKDKCGETPTGEYGVTIYYEDYTLFSGKFNLNAAAQAPETQAPEAQPTPTVAAPAADTQHPVSNLSVTPNGDGSYVLTWEGNGCAPYKVHYHDQWSYDQQADWNDPRTPTRWNDGSTTTECYATLAHLIPGKNYWLMVEDANGEIGKTIYRTPYAEATDMNMTIESAPRMEKNDQYTNLTAFSAAALKANAGEYYGLYIQLYYTGIAQECSKSAQFVITLPNGMTFVEYVFDLNLYPNGGTYWDFYTLEWAFSMANKFLDGDMAGEYRFDLYIEGKYAAGTTFRVTE